MAPSWLLLAWALGAAAPLAALSDSVLSQASLPGSPGPEASQAGTPQAEAFRPGPAPILAALPAATIDPDSRIEFTLHTRWGQTLHGRFPGVAGRIEQGADGQRQVRIVLDATGVDIEGYPRYTRFARGPSFFDVARHPTVEFVSEPYPERLLHDGGDLAGELLLHGVRRRERFVIVPSRCARPGLDCDIVAFGTVQRSDYGVDGWKIALREPVRFALRVRTRGDAS
jgi:polyisoprenoid-binding protein YceI